MKILTMNIYNFCIDEQDHWCQFSSTKKRLQEYIEADKEIDGTFRAIRMMDKIVKDGYFFRYIRM